VSVPLPVDGTFVGAFNAYACFAHALDPAAVKLGQDLGAYTTIVLNNAGLYFTVTTRADQLAQAMRSRAVIDQAKGILMGMRRCGADEAFDILVRLSQQSQRKLRDVAQALLEQTTGPQ
jgi:D-serine dehydratase